MEIANRIKSNDYKNITSLIYVEEGTYVSDATFKKFVESNGLVISKKDELNLVKEETLEGASKKTVAIEVGKDKTLKVQTVLKEGKWYVDLRGEVTGEYKITVPEGATLKLDGTIVDKKNIRKKKKIM